jgi:hypothetical protein
MLSLLLILKLVISLSGRCKNTPAITQSCGEGWHCLSGLSSRVLGSLRPMPALNMFLARVTQGAAFERLSFDFNAVISLDRMRGIKAERSEPRTTKMHLRSRQEFNSHHCAGITSAGSRVSDSGWLNSLRTKCTNSRCDSFPFSFVQGPFLKSQYPPQDLKSSLVSCLDILTCQNGFGQGSHGFTR